MLGDTGLDPRLLTLEITESVLMEQPDAVTDRLSAIRSLGVQTAVDDFGTGYSSLSSLTRFPIDELKIDRSFVAPLPADPATHRVTRAIVELAHSLDLRTVTEGIETRPQRDALAELGCDLGQGFLFARPLPADAVPSWRPVRVVGAGSGLNASG